MISRHSWSEIASKGLGSYTPRLLIKMSTRAKRRTTRWTTSAVLKSPAQASSLACGCRWRIVAIASLTRCSVRPLIMTVAPRRPSPSQWRNQFRRWNRSPAQSCFSIVSPQQTFFWRSATAPVIFRFVASCHSNSGAFRPYSSL
jgi:hypothetical protein